MNQMLNDLKLNPTLSATFQNNGSSDKSGTSSSSRPNSTSPPTSTHILNMIQEPIIREVWEENLEEEFKTIMNLIDRYNIIAMDTEFPGLVYRLGQDYQFAFNELEYKTIKTNVDALKVIQVGISLASEDGMIPEGVTTWQFNFQFDLGTDKYAQDAIDLLSNSGIQFDKHAKMGINPHLFAEYLISSGLALNDDIKWISFHGGFDFAYLVKMLNGIPLPDTDPDFYKLLGTYFPQFYDIKYMVKDIDGLKKSGGLNKLATDVNVKRIGPQHQAGSDSLLTLQTYFKLKETYLKTVPEKKYTNVLHGIGGEFDESSSYLWENYVVHDPSFYMMNYNYGMNSNPMMNTNFFPQTDPIYSGLNNGFTMNYNPMFNGFGQSMPYMDPNQKSKGKMDMFSNKVKS